MGDITGGKNGAPYGNQNAVRAKNWRQAINRVCAAKGGTVERGLDMIAEKLWEAAMRGESWAITELGNRQDGKPAQAIIGGDEDDPPLRIARVERVVIRAKPEDRDG